MSLVKVTSEALITMAGDSDLSEPREVLRGACERIGGVVDGLERVEAKPRALEAAAAALDASSSKATAH